MDHDSALVGVNLMSEKTSGLKRIFESQYKKLLIIPFIILVAAIVQISVQVATTGDFVNKGVGLKGGITMIVPVDTEVNLDTFENFITGKFKGYDINVRTINSGSALSSLVVEADIPVDDTETIDTLVSSVGDFLGRSLAEEDYSIEGIGSSLGESFFKEAFIAILVAFVFMGAVVFFYFRTLVPSAAVILCAFSDMLVTLAIFNITGMRLSTAGIAAFLMLIGYSVDTDILLSTRVLKRKEGTVMERVYSAMRTGFTMNLTTIAAVTAALILTQSDVIRQIMAILLIGLLVDMINTWIQNVGILRLYLEKKHKNKSENQ